jgi:AraC-like DNA-binding protein
MTGLPYHYDWKLAYQMDLGLRVHWFARFAGSREWSIPPSRLAADMVCFFFVERDACWTVVNGRKLLLNSGDLLVISGADEFSFGQDPGTLRTCLSACLAIREGGIANTLLQRKFQRHYSWPNPAEYIAEFERVLTALASTSVHRDLQIAGALLQWIAYVLSRAGAQVDPSVVEGRTVVDRILAAEAWANRHVSQSITLAQWAGAVGLNPVYFGRIFKRETGIRPIDWLNQRRLQMASQYLSSTRNTVAEIARACGFENQFYFSRVFRRYFGQSPLEYRKSKIMATVPSEPARLANGRSLALGQ